MDTSKLKKFAPACRTQLMDRIGVKLDYVLTAKTPDLSARETVIKELREAVAAEGRQGVIERVAYTWFNRFTALRFLDARDWHPFKVRVLTPASPQETLPQILKQLRTGSLPNELHRHADLKRLNDLLDGRLPTAIPGADPQAEVYKDLILATCRFYHALLPDLFERIDDATELLLPDDLLTSTSVAEGFRTEISDEDCSEVELLGWLYQFYISERKDQVMARKSAVPTEDIPAVTQLFTPHWIVRYLVENSLGRLWLLNRPGSRLREHMPYYIEGESETDFLKITKPEEIRLCDPAAGSGHMLAYAFDLFYLIYEEEGHTPSEIPGLILRHNLYGLEICSRAAQLAELALVFKSREKSRRFFQPDQIVRPQIIELKTISFEKGELADYFKAIGLASNPQLGKLLHQFEEAKNFGSLIQPCLDERAIAEARRAIDAKDLGGQLFLLQTHLKVLRVLEQTKVLSELYHVVVANPPYLGSGGMNARVKRLAEECYPDAKVDLYAAFIERGFKFTTPNGYLTMVTMHSWMFLSSFEGLRAKLLSEGSLLTLVHIGYNSFPEMNSKVVQACAFVFQNVPSRNKGFYLNLNNSPQSADKEVVFLNVLENGPVYRASRDEFEKIPGGPVAYWASPGVVRAFEEQPALGSMLTVKAGMSTTDNQLFLRLWHEVRHENLSLDSDSRDAAADSQCRWFPYIKGGGFRKWSGNKDYVVNWKNDGEDIRRYIAERPEKQVGGRLVNMECFFKVCLAWTRVSTGTFSARFYEVGSIFSDASNGAFGDPIAVKSALLFLNSRVSTTILRLISPTLNFYAGDIARLPFVANTDPAAADELINIACADWDNFETSWDFRDQPLLRPGLKGVTLEASWRNWEAQSTAAIRRMQELETENNRLFNAAYGLEGELESEVPEDQITLARADAKKDMAAFLSYAVGCMMGRYSLDHTGLILANAGDSLREFLEKVGKPLDDLTFAPDEAGIIPVLDGEWFEDDIVARARDFLRATFGEATLRENLRFIEESLGKDLRKYFLNDFYANHISSERAYGYKKRPIYWMFQSPKKHFRALIYLHRYTRDTVNTLLNDYLREFLHRLQAREDVLNAQEAAGQLTPTDRKLLTTIREAIRDVEDYERTILLPLAQKRIEIDLDDGVKMNYTKFGSALAPIPGLAAKDED